jgi:hypothetical protein
MHKHKHTHIYTHLFKLVDTEDAQCVTSVGAHFFSEARGVADVPASIAGQTRGDSQRRTGKTQGIVGNGILTRGGLQRQTDYAQGCLGQ